MSWVHSQVEKCAGYGLLKLNATHLEAIAQNCGFTDNFHNKGKSEYASLFYNVDASPMQKHMGFGMNMTTIFVLNQDWNGKAQF